MLVCEVGSIDKCTLLTHVLEWLKRHIFHESCRNLVKRFLGMAKTESHQELHIMRVCRKRPKVHHLAKASCNAKEKDTPAHPLKDIQCSCGFFAITMTARK